MVLHTKKELPVLEYMDRGYVVIYILLKYSHPYSDLLAVYLGTIILHFYNLLAAYSGTTIL